MKSGDSPTNVAVSRLALAELADSAHETVIKMRQAGAAPPEDLVDARDAAWEALDFAPDETMCYESE